MPKILSSKFTVVKLTILIGFLLLAGSSIAWWRLVYSDPTETFDRMLANSLATPSVTKTVNQNDESQRLKQVSVLLTGSQQIVASTSTLEQTDDSNTRVVTESIGTPTADYVRYTDITTGEKNSQGQQYDFSNVIGTWGKTSESNPRSGSVQLFNQTLLGVVPIANVPQPQRARLLQQIRSDEVYKYDANSVRRHLENGRPVYSYDVEIDPVGYVKMLKAFASALGLTQLEQVDPTQYENSAPLKFNIEVDVWSGQLVKISFESTNRNERSSGHGARIQIAEPESSIDVVELQMRLQQLQ